MNLEGVRQVCPESIGTSGEEQFGLGGGECEVRVGASAEAMRRRRSQNQAVGLPWWRSG